MNTEHDFQHIPQRPLSDGAAVEILNFLQEFTNEFENRYSPQIQRHYDQLYCGRTSLFDEVSETF
jgi:hypothetical protein